MKKCVWICIVLTLTDISSSESFSANWTRYLSYNEIVHHISSLSNSSDHLLVTEIGATPEGRPLQLVKICMKRNCGRKPAVWIDAGVHAREWISPMGALYVVSEVLTTPSALQGFDWYILPVVNPDGLVFSQKEKRFWRKSRSSHCGRGCYCKGVDLNRNFPYKWNSSEGDSSGNDCHPNYRGPRPLSDPESVAVKNFIWENRARIKVVISLHSYGQVILVPYTHTTEKVKNFDQIFSAASEASKAMEKVNGTVYQVGLSADLMGYKADGTFIDWTYSDAKITHSYIVELRPTRYKGTETRGVVGFLLSDDQITPTIQEAWEFAWNIAKHSLSKA